ncbi:MAG TPA: tetratricopeptide repeat-containing protein [Herpetosiphonaceae bacterium]
MASYLAELRSDVILAHPSLRGLHDGDVSTTAHDRHVGRTFLLSYQKLDPTRDALALALLARASCLAPGAPIPLDLLLASAELEPEDAAGQMALGRLADLGFVSLGDEGVVLHRLVHAFVGGVAANEAALAAVEGTIIDQAYAINEASYSGAMAPLVPHLAWATRDHGSREDVPMARLCNTLDCHWSAVGDYGTARPFAERALAINERVLGPDHPNTATSLNNLAALYVATGAYGAAQPLYERALAIQERVLGPDHPDTASSLNNLASLYVAMGMPAAARPLFERALAICERVLGIDHPDTATSRWWLGELELRANNQPGAVVLLTAALASFTRMLGKDHPTTQQLQRQLTRLGVSPEAGTEETNDDSH